MSKQKFPGGLRVKIEGQITPERLTEALYLASDHCGEELSGFYGCNLYLVAFGHDGAPLELEGEEMILVPAPPGDIVRPALTSQAVQRQREEKRQQDELVRKAREESLRQQAEQQAEYQRRKEKREQLRQHVQARHARLTWLLARLGDELLSELNNVIEASWATRQPRFPHGTQKGELRNMPWFAADSNGEAVLFRDRATKTSHIRIRSEFYATSRHGDVEHFWQFDEWKATVADLQKAADALLQKHKDDLSS